MIGSNPVGASTAGGPRGLGFRWIQVVEILAGLLHTVHFQKSLLLPSLASWAPWSLPRTMYEPSLPSGSSELVNGYCGGQNHKAQPLSRLSF